MKKPNIFKMLDVERKALLRMPGNALKIWLYYWMREGRERIAWASEEEICRHVGLNPKTMRTWRKWLVINGWLKPMGYRSADSGEFAVPKFRVDEGTLPETKSCPSDRIQNLVACADQVLGDRPAPSLGSHRIQNLDEEVETSEVDTKEQVDTKEVEPPSVFLSDSLTDSLRSSQHVNPKNEPLNGSGAGAIQKPTPWSPASHMAMNHHTAPPAVVDLMLNYLPDPRLTNLFGLERNTEVLEPELIEATFHVASALYNRDRSPDWLWDMLRWIRNRKSREARFWNDGKLVTGEKGWLKLAEYLEKGTLPSQFDAHLANIGVELNKESAYVLSHTRIGNVPSIEEIMVANAAGEKL